MESPPMIPSRSFSVFFARSRPSGMLRVTVSLAVMQRMANTSFTDCRIIRRGTGLMAHSPTGTASPGFVTLPIPSPPSMTTTLG